MSFEDCIDKLEQLICDENKIVTYKMLSRELKIHVNKAKMYMFEFLMKQNLKANANLQVHYFLAGDVGQDNRKVMKVLVVSQDAVEQAKQKFRELTSCHIYSINKEKIMDECALCTADISYSKDIEEQNEYSAIKHRSIEIQPPVLNKINIMKKDNESEFLKKQTGVTMRNSISLTVITQKDDKKERIGKSPLITGENRNDEKLQNVKEMKKSPEKKEKNTLMAMWQKNEKSSNVKKESARVEGKGKNKSVQETAKNFGKNNIMSMFSKQAEKNASNLNKKSSVANPLVEQEIAVACDAKSINAPCKDVVSKVSKSVSKSSQKRKSSERKSNKFAKQKKDSESEDEFQPKAKKHRRICTFEESESDSESEEAQDKALRSIHIPEDPTIAIMEESEDSEDPIPPTPPVIPKGKSRILKTVKKTYQDEEGFFVTKTEKELVSASEDEEDPLKAKAKELISDKTMYRSHYINRKQASLISFFKQK